MPIIVGRLEGPQGETGATGPSAYDVAVAEGFTGTEAEWLVSLRGPQGDRGDDGTQGDPGNDGSSAYELAVAAGFVGTEAEWLASLRGADGADGLDGADGSDGAAATVAIGSVTTSAPGTSASVVNSGSGSAAVLDITIPRGDPGAAGDQGLQGDAGNDGLDGADGAAATVAIGTVSTLAPGAPASVTNVGTPNAAILDIGIPRGAAGAAGSDGADGDPGSDGTDGQDGAAATVAIGTVSTLPAGSPATVANSGTPNAAVLDFGIPQGDDGAGGGGGEYMVPIWAEENAGLANNGYEWAFGNGANTPSNNGITIYVPPGWSAAIVAMTATTNNAGGTATIEANINGTVQGAACNVTLAGRSGVNDSFPPVPLNSGDRLTFRTTTSGVNSGPNSVCAWIRYTQD